MPPGLDPQAGGLVVGELSEGLAEPTVSLLESGVVHPGEKRVPERRAGEAVAVPIGQEDVVRRELLEERERSAGLATAQQGAELESRIVALKAQALRELSRRLPDEHEPGQERVVKARRCRCVRRSIGQRPHAGRVTDGVPRQQLP